jgi:hypothetical protein
MTPEAITLLFWEARKAFPPLEGKPLDDDLTTIRETLLPILMEIPLQSTWGGSTPSRQSSRTQGGTPPTMAAVHLFARAACHSTIRILPTMHSPSSESTGKQSTVPDSTIMPSTKRPSTAQPSSSSPR